MRRNPLVISNHIANLLYELGEGRHVPASVRYGAADRAIAEVTAWLNDPAPKIPDVDTGADGNNNQHPQGTTNHGI